eukprot:6701134-Prymnesium_polylepis.1
MDGSGVQRPIGWNHSIPSMRYAHRVSTPTAGAPSCARPSCRVPAALGSSGCPGTAPLRRRCRR